MSDYYYVSYGQDIKMYTLRQVASETRWTRGEGGAPVSYVAQTDWHIQNLSTDLDAAYAKASEIAGKGFSEAHSTKSTLGEIYRRNEEEMAAARELEAERDEARMRQQELRDSEYRLSLMEKIEMGIMPFGKHRDRKITEIEGSYFLFIFKMDFDENFRGVIATLESYVRATRPAIFTEMPTIVSGHFGTEGKRQVITAIVSRVSGFDGYYGWTNIYNLITEDGYELTYMGSAAPFGDVGEKFTFTAGIKEHGEYQDKPQTKIQRVTKVTAL